MIRLLIPLTIGILALFPPPVDNRGIVSIQIEIPKFFSLDNAIFYDHFSRCVGELKKIRNDIDSMAIVSRERNTVSLRLSVASLQVDTEMITRKVESALPRCIGGYLNHLEQYTQNLNAELVSLLERGVDLEDEQIYVDSELILSFEKCGNTCRYSVEDYALLARIPLLMNALKSASTIEQNSIVENVRVYNTTLITKQSYPFEIINYSLWICFLIANVLLAKKLLMLLKND